jgi:hypothetical protein
MSEAPSNESGAPPVSPLEPGKATPWSRFISPAIILLAAALAGTPLHFRSYSCGHDFDFHLVSWFEVLSSWHHGILYPHWAASPNFGAGEPRFLFYPPLTWMLGALLAWVGGWDVATHGMVYLLLAATGLGTWALAREVLDDAPATLAGCAAIFSGYALFTAYERSAYGELTGGLWIPLLLLFALRDRKPSGQFLNRAFDGSTLPLALVLAGAWLSNVPLGVMASYLLAAVVVVAALLRKSWTPVLRASIGGLLGFGLSSIYLLPAVWEQRWVDVQQAIDDPGSRIESSWLFARHADPALELHDTELLKVSIIAATMLAVCFGSVFLAWMRGKLTADRSRWIILASIPVVILLLQLPVSLPVWNLLPKLRFLQFPWRWLVVLEAPMAIFFAVAVWPARRWRRVLVLAFCMAVFGAATVFAGYVFFQVCDPEDTVSAMAEAYDSGAGYEGTDEYEPPGADDSMVATGLPSACLVRDASAELGKATPDANPDWYPEQGSCEATFAAISRSPEHMHVEAAIARAGYLILRLRSYPAWRISVNGQVVHSLPQREDGLIAVPVAQGPVDLAVDWTATPDVIAGRWLSGIALLMLVPLGWLERRLGRNLERRLKRGPSGLRSS